MHNGKDQQVTLITEDHLCAGKEQSKACENHL